MILILSLKSKQWINFLKNREQTFNNYYFETEGVFSNLSNKHSNSENLSALRELCVARNNLFLFIFLEFKINYIKLFVVVKFNDI